MASHGSGRPILGALGNSVGTATTKEATDRGTMEPGLYRIDMDAGLLIPVKIGAASGKAR